MEAAGTPPTPTQAEARKGPPGQQPRRRTVPMGLILGGVYGLLVLVSLAVVLALSASSNYANTYSLLNDKAILLMRGLTDRIYVHLKPAEQAVHQVAAVYRDGGFAIEDDRSRDAIVTGVLAASDAIQAIVVYDMSFRSTGSFRDADGNIRPIGDRSVTQPDVIAALKTLKPDEPFRWGDLVFVGGESFVNVVAPLVRDGTIHGYVVAAVGAQILSEIVSRVGVEDGATAFILYGDDRLFAYSRGADIGLPQQLEAAKGPVPLAEVRDPVLASFAERVPLKPFRRAERVGIEVSEVETADGGEYVLLTRPVTEFGPVPWVAGLYLPQEAVISVIRRLYGSIAIGILMLVAAVVVSLLIARRVGRSLEQLNREAGHVARFEIEEARELPRSRITELDAAATAFNGMLNGLRAFALYVPRALVRRLLKLGFEEATRLRKREATVLFTDIVGFTALSETMSTEEVARLLNGHFARLVACVEAEEGTVDKFIGDGLMAVWSNENPADNARRAIRAAVRIAAAIAEENAAARAEGRPVLRLRVGVHSGPVIVGNLGAAGRVNYTIIGDTVNVASRLESLGKSVAADEECVILASARTVDLVVGSGLPIRFGTVGATTLRGRSGAVDVRRILDCPTLTDESGAARAVAE
jgi:adenylate cyclase